MMNKREKEALKGWISSLRDIGVRGTFVEKDLFLVGYLSQFDMTGQEDILELGEDMDLLVTLYPELKDLNEDIMKILKEGLSSWYSTYRNRWMY